MRLDSRRDAIEGAQVVVPGQADQSAVYQRIISADDPMPPRDFRHQLSDREIRLIRKWIEQGAEYETHWSYTKIGSPTVPKLRTYQDRVANPIDAFVIKKLESKGLAPAPLAGKNTLLRRLSLDLIGLPPTRSELAEFLADDSEDAYEKQVDRLLASPHYGERMASRWLDIVRFSDTVGFHGDQNQHIFPYRDYVIDSINNNQPFDQFTIEQLAGDLLEQPTEKQLVATGLIRLNMMTREGGAQPEEYLAKYSADRVRMIGTAWLGSTLGCCECHDHKYDPFSIEDFYSMAAFFDDVRQWGVYSNYGYTPNPDLRGFSNDHPFPPEIRIKSKTLMRQIEHLESELDRAAASMVSDEAKRSDEFVSWLNELASRVTELRSVWIPMVPDSVVTKKNEKFRRLDDGTFVFTERPKGGQTISLLTSFAKPMWVKAIKLQVLPDKANGGNVGRSDGRFTAKLSVKHLPRMTPDEEFVDVRPRYVRIEIPGNRKILSIAELQILGQENKQQINYALKGKASQSSVDHGGVPELAIDGNTDGDNKESAQTTHTRTENNPWWEVDLLDQKDVDKIVVWNRTDGGLGKRLNGFRISLLDANRNLVYEVKPGTPNPKVELAIPEKVTATSLRQPEKIAYAQADRYTPTRYSNGKANKFLGDIWKSGPSQWQLPLNEANLEHNAVFHLAQPIRISEGDSLEISIGSSDIGRFRLFTSPVSRPVVDSETDKFPETLASWTQVCKTGDGDLTAKQRTRLASAYYRSTVPESMQDATVRRLRDEIADCYSGFALTMISQPTESDKRRVSKILPRGDWKDKSGKIVKPNTPGFLPRSELNKDRIKNRADLARWIVSDENTLTARHFVNRTWKHFFGKGISNVLDDLGNQGEWPSHPQLLDWLATEFRSDWDRKRLTRMIVTSNTYRQQAGVRRELLDSDPDNRLLANQSPRRLEAEIVRDNALAIAGLLNLEWVGGRSAFPYQPPGYYSNLQFPNRRYQPQTNGLQYRRGVYMHWQRTFLHPMLTNFDAPSRDECTADRPESNSPQQALTLLNDPVFVEAAKVFAIRLLRDYSDGRDSDNRIRGQKLSGLVNSAFELSLSRPPSEQELQSLSKLYQRQRTHYEQNPDEAKQFAAVGQSAVPEELDIIDVAAMGQVCRVILNLHETINRY